MSLNSFDFFNYYFLNKLFLIEDKENQFFLFVFIKQENWKQMEVILILFVNIGEIKEVEVKKLFNMFDFVYRVFLC